MRRYQLLADFKRTVNCPEARGDDTFQAPGLTQFIGLAALCCVGLVSACVVLALERRRHKKPGG